VGSEKILYHCGFEDTVLRHLMLIKDIDDLPDDSRAERKVLIEKANFSRRLFTVQCIHNMECLVLTFKDIQVIKKDF